MTNLENVRDALERVSQGICDAHKEGKDWPETRDYKLVLDAISELEAYMENDGWLPIGNLEKQNIHLWLWIEYKDRSGTGFPKRGFMWEGDGKIEIYGFNDWDYEHKEITHYKPYIEHKPPKQTESNGHE